MGCAHYSIDGLSMEKNKCIFAQHQINLCVHVCMCVYAYSCIYVICIQIIHMYYIYTNIYYRLHMHISSDLCKSLAILWRHINTEVGMDAIIFRKIQVKIRRYMVAFLETQKYAQVPSCDERSMTL